MLWLAGLMGLLAAGTVGVLEMGTTKDDADADDGTTPTGNDDHLLHRLAILDAAKTRHGLTRRERDSALALLRLGAFERAQLADGKTVGEPLAHARGHRRRHAVIEQSLFDAVCGYLFEDAIVLEDEIRSAAKRDGQSEDEETAQHRRVISPAP